MCVIKKYVYMYLCYTGNKHYHVINSMFTWPFLGILTCVSDLRNSYNKQFIMFQCLIWFLKQSSCSSNLTRILKSAFFFFTGAIKTETDKQWKKILIYNSAILSLPRSHNSNFTHFKMKEEKWKKLGKMLLSLNNERHTSDAPFLDLVWWTRTFSMFLL